MDDSKAGQGKHIHVVSLPSYKMSILPFVNPQRKKEELNRMFQKQHPKISRNISLSQIRALKLKLIEVFVKEDDPYIEVYTLAHAWVLFEKLIYRGIVKKHNRKIMAVTCLFIAFKYNDAYGGYENNEQWFQRFKGDLKDFIGYWPQNAD